VQLFNTKELIKYIREYEFGRKITQFHIHHTWKPNYSHFNGKNHESLQRGMRNYHVNTMGWADIAQHFTLFPDGTWALGRPLSKKPVSISGWNTGAVMVEMVGDFDKGRDQMTVGQKNAILEITKFMKDELGLRIVFHRDSPRTSKTCPGSGIDKVAFMLEVEEFRGDYVSSRFVDTKGHWAEDYIDSASDLGIIKGVSADGEAPRFNPDDKISRAEAVVVIMRAIDYITRLVKEVK